MTFASIPTFTDALDRLCKKERDGYRSCKSDICKHFKNLAFTDIWELNYRLREFEDMRLIKVRIPNSKANFSASEGFRVIICCHRKYQLVGLLNIYPKKGKHGMENQSKADTAQQLKMFSECLRTNTLKQHNIQQELELLHIN